MLSILIVQFPLVFDSAGLSRPVCLGQLFLYAQNKKVLICCLASLLIHSLHFFLDRYLVVFEKKNWVAVFAWNWSRRLGRVTGTEKKFPPQIYFKNDKYSKWRFGIVLRVCTFARELNFLQDVKIGNRVNYPVFSYIRVKKNHILHWLDNLIRVFFPLFAHIEIDHNSTTENLMRKDISCFVVYFFKSETNEKNPEFIFFKSIIFF